MSITGNVINVEKIQLTDTFQTWFAKTNEVIDAINPVNIYDIDDGIGTDVSFGQSGPEYNGVKYVNVRSGYGVAVGAGSGLPWTGNVSLNLGSISGASYTLTGNEAYTATGSAAIASEVNVNDMFVVLDTSDTSQGASGTTKLVPAKYMIPRELYMPTLNFWGDLNIKGNFTSLGAASTQVGNLAINSQYIYLATTGSGFTGGQYSSDSTLNQAGLIVAMTGGAPQKTILWNHNSGNSYWAFGSTYGANDPDFSLVNTRFISRNFVSGDTNNNNVFIFEAAGSTSTRIWLTESGVGPYFGIVKEANSSNVNLNAYQGAGITSVAFIRSGATSQYPGITANAFIQFANVDMLDGSHAVTGASAWTIPVSDALGELRPERHNAGQVKRRYLQTSHGLTTGEAVAIVPNISPFSATIWGSLTGADASNSALEAIGIVDRVISNNEVSVTLKGHVDLSANGLKGIGSPVTGQYYYLDWNNKGGLTTNTNVPQSFLYQPVFVATSRVAGLIYGNESEIVFPNKTDEVYMRGMIPIGMIQPYAGSLAGLTMGLSSGTIPVSDVQYNSNYLPCDGRAVGTTGSTGFADLFSLIRYSYPMRGTVTSSNNDPRIIIRPDRGTANISTLTFGAGGVFKAIRRSGTNSVNLEYSTTYTSLTADANTITISGIGITTQPTQLEAGIIVDISTLRDGLSFFLPDLRGKSPFGEYGPQGLLGQGFNLGTTGGTSFAGQTGATAFGNGGLFTNYIIRAKRESDALILTGHNHDSRYLRKDADSVADATTTLNLQNLNVNGRFAALQGLTITGNVLMNDRLDVRKGSTFSGDMVIQGGSLTVTGSTLSRPAFHVRTNNCVGIGTTAPTSALQIQGLSGNITTTIASVSDGIVTQYFGYIGVASDSAFSGTVSSHPLTFMTNNIRRAAIDATGNFGIFDAGSPTVPLTLQGYGSSVLSVTALTGASLLLRHTNTTTDYQTKFISSKDGILQFGRAGDTGNSPSVQMEIDFGGNARFYGNGAFDKNINANGFLRVGVGATSSASYPVGISGSLSVGQNAIDIIPTGSADGQLKIQGNGYAGYVALDMTGMHVGHNSSTRVLTFDVNETERMRIDANGDVGIGVNPITKITGITTLDIGGNTGAGINIRGTGAGTINMRMFCTDTNTFLGTQSNHALRLMTNNIEQMRITPGGTAGIGTSAPDSNYKLHVQGKIFASDDITAFSDARYKTDISPINQALLRVCGLTGVLYTDTEGNRKTGLLAQDVQKVIPEAVTEGDDGKLSLAYGNLVGLLVESIKELKARLDETERLLKSKE